MIADFQIQRVNWQSHGPVCAGLRKQVFFTEAHYHYYTALDGLDETAHHVLALSAGGDPIGCGRITTDWQISRIAVLKPWRERGIGTALLDELIAIARDDNATEVSSAVPLFSLHYYRGQQFEEVGAVFRDAEVSCQRLRLVLANRRQQKVEQR